MASLCRIMAVMLVSASALVGCLNQIGAKKPRNAGSPLFSSFSLTSTTNAVEIHKVLRTQSNPLGSVDLLAPASSLTITDATHGELGDFCAPAQTGGAASCRCVFRVDGRTTCPTGTVSAASCTSENVVTEQRYVPLYFEADLVRCGLPEDLSANVIEIRLEREGGSRSNSVSFTISPQLSFDDPLFYSDVRRYACRWSPFVSHIMDGAMIDPAQADSQHSSLSLIFYTTDMGRSMAQFSALEDTKQQYFECPPHADPAKVSLAMRSSGNGFTALSTNDGTPIGNNDAVNFVLARTPSGPFQVPLAVSQAPGIPADPPLGYAAAPDSFGRCPGDLASGDPRNVSIPSNMEWRKLWLFRGVLDRRKAWTVPKFQRFDVACNPGTFSGTALVSRITAPHPATGVSTTFSLTANSYYKFSDCGKYGEVKNSTDQYPILDTGTECRLRKDGISYLNDDGLSRIILPRNANTNASSSGSSLVVGDHRCVSFRQDDPLNPGYSSGETIQDFCRISLNSCKTPAFATSMTDILNLCKAPRDSDELNLDYSGSTNVLPIEIPSPVEYLFYTTATSVSSLGALQIERPRFLDPAHSFIMNPNSEQASESYGNVTSINGASFPLCVLRRRASP